jgi:hypothetical protein
MAQTTTGGERKKSSTTHLFWSCVAHCSPGGNLTIFDKELLTVYNTVLFYCPDSKAFY